MQSGNLAPKYFIVCLKECDDYPPLHQFLKIGATIPVTTATCERPFTTVRRVNLIPGVARVRNGLMDLP
jgi:hypothetical protein